MVEARFEPCWWTAAVCLPPGKVHRAVLAVQRSLRRWPWFVQVDVDGYFPSIRHDLLMALLRRRFKGAGFLALLQRILDGGATAGPGRGCPSAPWPPSILPTPFSMGPTVSSSINPVWAAMCVTWMTCCGAARAGRRPRRAWLG
jgi:hypothetical protein